ncbi:MAG: hypothetical protein E7E68_11115, partial [Staphylococcus sp.]|nr:hypothetical protein [Staphylococcus sp.]
MTDLHEAVTAILLGSTRGEDVASSTDEEACAGGGEAVHVGGVPDAAWSPLCPVNRAVVVPGLA